MSKKIGKQLTPMICLSLCALYQFEAGSSARGQVGTSPTRIAAGRPGEYSGNSLLLSPGDLLDVEVFSTPELSAPRVRISQDGTIALPVTGVIKVSGLTPLEADAAIERRLRDGQILLNPSVTVLVEEYATKGIDVLGEVKTPGIYTFLGPHTLYDALSAAGGFTTLAGSTITVTRPGDESSNVIVDVGAPNFPAVEQSTVVNPGDVVEVSRANSIYVVGDVAHSGQFPIALGHPITALDALALAQGPNPNAKMTKASIVRKTASGGAQLIPLDLKQVEKTASLDPILQPDDVLVIPRSDAKAMLTILIPGATSSVIGAIAYGYIRN